MIEYGAAYYEGNEEILAQMKASMSPEAWSLAMQMAEEILWEDDEDPGFTRNVDLGAEILYQRCRQDD